jgi:beta-lactamase superfamily II metal-dependent hydrolase
MAICVMNRRAPALERGKKWRGEKTIRSSRRGAENILSGAGLRAFCCGRKIPGDELATGAKKNDSLPMRLQYGQRSILLPGNAEKPAECSMLGECRAAELHADVLKLGHHGGARIPPFRSF